MDTYASLKIFWEDAPTGGRLRWPRKMREMSACAAVPPLGFDHTHRCHHFASYLSISPLRTSAYPSPARFRPTLSLQHTTPLVGFARRPRPETTPMHRHSSALSDTFSPVRSQPRASISPAARVLRPGSRRDHAFLLLSVRALATTPSTARRRTSSAHTRARSRDKRLRARGRAAAAPRRRAFRRARGAASAFTLIAPLLLAATPTLTASARCCRRWSTGSRTRRGVR